MKPTIVNILKSLEQEKGIRILFAVESGSRAWGMESLDSDFDVRFVYVYPLKNYISITSPEDVIERSCDASGKPSGKDNCLIDIVGFDVFKYLKMLSSSNPTTIEWLRSPILYLGRREKSLVKLAEHEFNPVSLYHHYKSMAKQNYIKYIKSKNHVTHKKYLYSLRGALSAQWIAHKKTLPPVNFNELLELLKTEGTIVASEILDVVHLCIHAKKQGQEKSEIKNIKLADEYLENFILDEKVVELLQPRRMDSQPIQEFLHKEVLNDRI